jgi:phospho-N-acetylmuramoyl-pentapeptide-transferase
MCTPDQFFASERIFILTALSFVVSFLATPLLTNWLYKMKAKKQIRNDGTTPVFSKLHEHKTGTPTMGGILIWATTLVVSLFIALIVWFWPSLSAWNFLSRGEVWLPLFAMVAASLVGLVDDLLNIKGIGGGKGGGLRMRDHLLLYTIIALIGALWFYFKLDWDILRIPFVGNFEIGWWIIPLFTFVVVATSFSSNIADGLDGLAGGILLSSFATFGAIAFIQGKYDLATLCGVITGALLTFLWFNVHPARFIMGDTGVMGLGVALGVIAMLTNTVLLLPIIAFLLVVESMSVIIQVFWRKVFHKKFFLSAPIHHHFEAKGWPEQKVVMRFWLISGVTAIIGFALFLMDK